METVSMVMCIISMLMVLGVSRSIRNANKVLGEIAEVAEKNKKEHAYHMDLLKEEKLK